MKKSLAVSSAVFLAPLLLLATQRQATAGNWFCGFTLFCKPKPPCVKYCCICPAKINPCCGLDNFGFYPACWQPWPFPRRDDHCVVPAPVVFDLPKSTATAKSTASPEELPVPSKAQPDMEPEKPADAKEGKDKNSGVEMK